MELVKKLLEFINTITADSQAGILKKCEEFGFDPNKADITLEESFINLNQSRDIVKDAIDKNKLSQFPLTVQKAILQDFENVISFQSSLISGADQVINLVNAIEQLYTDIWRFGVHNLSGEVLGYVTKMNQLKDQELRISLVEKELEKGLQVKTDLETLMVAAQASNKELESFVTSSRVSNGSINENLEKSIESSQKAAAHLASIQQNDINATQLLTNSVSSNSEIQALETKIREFFTSIDGYRKAIDSTSKDAKQSIQTNKDETDILIGKLKDLQEQIKDQLQKATGFSLFHSFQTRQGNLKDSKNFWLVALALVISLSLGLTGLISYTTVNIDLAFYLKLSISIPLIYAIAFCSAQYTRERKLEEEYAFKSNISISLIPYKELVEKLVSNGTPQEREQFTSFLIDSIGKVFTSPTNKIFGQNQSDVKPEVAMKQLSKQVEALVKPFESIIKIVKPN